MPLSEDEQRILTEIQRQLVTSDPDLAREVGKTTIYTDALRKCRFAAVGIVVGLVLTVVLLPVSFWASFVAGFGLMLGSAYVLQQNMRHISKMGIAQVGATIRGNGMRDMIAQAQARAKDRMARDDESDDA